MVSTTLTVAYLLLQAMGVCSAGHALLNKDDPRSALGWVALCLMLPGVGMALYWMFGVNRIRTHARRLQHPASYTALMRMPLMEGAEQPDEKYRELARTALAVTEQEIPLGLGSSGVRLLQLGRAIDQLLGTGSGGDVHVLVNTGGESAASLGRVSASSANAGLNPVSSIYGANAASATCGPNASR